MDGGRGGRDGGRPGALRLYLLDDHEMLRRGVRDMLVEAGGFEIVGESWSALEALRVLPALRPDVALLDVRLPDGSGTDVCRHVRAQDPRIRVVILTTFDDAETRLAAATAGAEGFVSKRISGSQLVTTVRRVAAGACLLDPLAAAEAARRSRTASRDPRLAALTGQEQRVLDLIADGLTNRQIGERLGIGENTVKNYVTGVLLKLGLSRRTQAAVVGSRARGY